ncbi:MAG: hypothetical protein JWO05_1018 [Gemmatimonadetes bacterium]|nr:hypothetical protein [Gemmatimonadota bacterium]
MITRIATALRAASLATLLALPPSLHAQSPGPFVVVPHAVISETSERLTGTDLGFGLGAAAGWSFSGSSSAMIAGDISWMNVDRTSHGTLLFTTALLLRQRSGMLGATPVSVFAGPLYWEGDNSGVGVMAGLDLDAAWWTRTRALIGLDVLFFAASRWPGQDPATSLPNSTTHDPRLSLRLRFGGLRELRAH